MDANAATTGPFVRQPAAGSTLNVLGVTHIYKATGAETAGSFSLWEDLVPPGTGAPPHTHEREDEAFYVLSGEIQIEFEGEPAPEIAKAVRDYDIDLVTVVTHGRRGLARALFGSTAEEIIAEAPCPVLTVRGK